MSEQNKAAVRRLIEEVCKRGNFAVVDELVAGDFLGHSNSAEDETRGTEEADGTTAYRQYFGALRGAFPDIRFTVKDQIAEGDRVATRWSASGTLLGAYMGIPPTGRAGLIGGITVYRIAEGKVAEGWTQLNELGMLTQLGVIAAPAPAA
jgi:steroid delta-isomerase-like uncharacterized protein